MNTKTGQNTKNQVQTMNKKRLDKKEIFAVIFAELCCILIMYFSVGNSEVYGSSLDWSSQHYAIPEYFRTLFYKTGDLFPSLGANIGAGENIFSLSYYGLFSPVILPSYLLPWVDMATYIMIVSIAGILISVILFYLWLRSKFSVKVSFIALMIFSLSTPLIFHSHRHIMFVSYMPFLISALHFTEVYFNKNHCVGLIISCLLIILTNYFFAVSALFVVLIYAVYLWIKKNEDVSIKGFFKIGSGFAYCILTSVFIAGVLLIPTVMAILLGRDAANVNIDFKDFIPFFHLEYLTFDTYSLGLTSFVIIAIIDNLLYGSRENKFLSIVFCAISIFPVCIFILNGGMYFDSKVLIPFLPMAVLLCAETIKRLLANTYKYKHNIIIYAVISVCFISYSMIKIFSGHTDTDIIARIGYMIDFVFMLAVLLICCKIKKNKALIIYTVSYAFVSCLIVNANDKYQPMEKFEKDNSEYVEQLIDSAANYQNSLTRTACQVDKINTVNKVYSANHYQTNIYSSVHNKNYNHFYFEELYNENAYRNSALTTSSRNLLFNIYMGNKYIVSDKNYIPGEYKAIEQVGDYTLYENDDCFPIGYSSSDIMSVKQYESLSYPYNIEALLKYTIVDSTEHVDYHSDIEKYEINDIFANCEKLSFENGKYISDSKEEYTYTYNMPQDMSDKILFIRFKVDNDFGLKKNDAKVRINNIINVLTSPEWKYYNNNNSFEYVIADCTDKLEMIFSNGRYAIYDIEAYTLDKSAVTSLKENKQPFISDMAVTNGDEISGKITAENDGYFNISMIYHDGYKVYVDGKETEPEMVDTAFLGFKLNKGEHDIKIIYTAKGLLTGKIVSCIGILMFIAIVVFKTKRNKQKNSNIY